MKELKNKTLQHFLADLNEELKEQNQLDGKYDIPFMLAPLYSDICNNETNYKEFEEMLSKYEYSLYTEPIDERRCHVIVYFCEVQDTSIEIEFGYDEEYMSYCDCKPGDPDYREDKHCCGHGCNWDRPTFILRKRSRLVNECWYGDEHDYWDFEDMYYKKEKEEATKKLIQTKKREIEYWKDVIKNAENKLEELENGTINGERITSIISEYDREEVDDSFEENRQIEEEIDRLKKKIANSYKK